MGIVNLLEFTERAQLREWFMANLQRCADLEQRGLMTDAGREAMPTNGK